jgi:hypothetical protein
MIDTRSKTPEFRNFKLGIVQFLLLSLVLFALLIWLLKIIPSITESVSFGQWSTITDWLNLILGVPIAFAGAYVAIAIASRAADIAAHQQAQENYSYYEDLHQQLIDNYFGIAQAANQLVSSANRFEEAFFALLTKETSAKYSVINFIDDDHRRNYVQGLLAKNHNGITNTLMTIHSDIKQNIGKLLDAIELAFKHSIVNETWAISVSAPDNRNLLVECFLKKLFHGRFSDDADLSSWLNEAKAAVVERLDLQEISQSISADSDKAHPLLPFCLYLNELNDYQNRSGNSINLEVLLAGYFLMTHISAKEDVSNTYFNSGALFLVDLIETFPQPDSIKYAFAKRLAHISSVSQGSIVDHTQDDLYQKSTAAYQALTDENKALFSLLAENIQLKHYAPRIRKTRNTIMQVLDAHQGEGEVPLLQIKYELLSKSEVETITDKL